MFEGSKEQDREEFGQQTPCFPSFNRNRFSEHGKRIETVVINSAIHPTLSANNHLGRCSLSLYLLPRPFITVDIIIWNPGWSHRLMLCCCSLPASTCRIRWLHIKFHFSKILPRVLLKSARKFRPHHLYSKFPTSIGDVSSRFFLMYIRLRLHCAACNWKPWRASKASVNSHCTTNNNGHFMARACLCVCSWNVNVHVMCSRCVRSIVLRISYEKAR